MYPSLRECMDEYLIDQYCYCKERFLSVLNNTFRCCKDAIRSARKENNTQLGEAVVARLISDCVEIIFDVNLENSLKSQTRKERGTGILQKVVVEV
jgi:hypothetical protein